MQMAHHVMHSPASPLRSQESAFSAPALLSAFTTGAHRRHDTQAAALSLDLHVRPISCKDRLCGAADIAAR